MTVLCILAVVVGVVLFASFALYLAQREDYR